MRPILHANPGSADSDPTTKKNNVATSWLGTHYRLSDAVVSDLHATLRGADAFVIVDDSSQALLPRYGSKGGTSWESQLDMLKAFMPMLLNATGSTVLVKMLNDDLVQSIDAPSDLDLYLTQQEADGDSPVRTSIEPLLDGTAGANGPSATKLVVLLVSSSPTDVTGAELRRFLAQKVKKVGITVVCVGDDTTVEGVWREAARGLSGVAVLRTNDARAVRSRNELLAYAALAPFKPTYDVASKNRLSGDAAPEGMGWTGRHANPKTTMH